MKKCQAFTLLFALLLPTLLYSQNNSNDPLKYKIIRVSPAKYKIRVSPGVLNQLVIHKVKPEYPEEARAKHIKGAVTLNVLVDPDGNVARSDVVRGDAILAEAALKAVQQWKYKPFTINGEPVAVESRVTLNFPH